MSTKVLFLANKLALGGLEKVTVAVSNGLSHNNNVTLYSLKGDTYGYHFSNSLTYLTGKNLNRSTLIHPILTLKALIGKKLVQKKTLTFTRIQKDIDFKKYENVILSEADIFFAQSIRKINPNINIIGWIHNTFESYRETYMRDSYSEFINSLSYINTLVVLTESDKKEYLNLHDNVVKINNPLTITSPKYIPSKKKQSKKIAFVGRLEYKSKGLDYLIDIAKNLPDGWKISIAGDGNQREKFIHEIEEKN